MVLYENLLVSPDSNIIDGIYSRFVNKKLFSELTKVVKQDRHTEISIFNFESPSGQPGQILIFHDYESAGICFGSSGEPIWGDWDDCKKTITVGDENVIYNTKGELLAIDPF
jgi:hypothetical protein